MELITFAHTSAYPDVLLLPGFIATAQLDNGTVQFFSRLDTETIWVVDHVVTATGEVLWDHPYGARHGHTNHVAAAPIRDELNRELRAYHHPRAQFLRRASLLPYTAPFPN
ncbi:hypothetical protein [Nocardia tengchongensis]|uniref:hypothetical protein n=1 Tax=Nocardia tengchongensis TaxID=2055889 RepID=UPI00367FD0B0